MGAQFPWQIVPLSIDLINTYDLLDTDLFKDLGVLKPIIESSTIPQLQELALSLATAVNAGLLSEVNTYTWRSPDVMLSTAQDWRKGQRSEQVPDRARPRSIPTRSCSPTIRPRTRRSPRQAARSDSRTTGPARRRRPGRSSTTR